MAERFGKALCVTALSVTLNCACHSGAVSLPAFVCLSRGLLSLIKKTQQSGTDRCEIGIVIIAHKDCPEETPVCFFDSTFRGNAS